MLLTESTAPQGFDLGFALNVAAPLCQAAYAVMQSDGAEPELPAGYRMTAIIKAGAGQLAGMAKRSRRPGDFHDRMSQEKDIFGLIGKNPDEKIAFVSFRGTENATDWAHDLDALYEPYGFVPGTGDVHLGFHEVYKTLRPTVLGALQEASKDCEHVFVTGHSLGGALAVLSAPDLAVNAAAKQIPKLLTFAGPRAGLLEFHRFVNNLMPICYRVVSSGDIVPHVPFFIPPFIYEHVGVEVKVDGGQDDPVKAHSLLLSYLPGLERLQAAI
jgi:predicted lipase